MLPFIVGSSFWGMLNDSSFKGVSGLKCMSLFSGIGGFDLALQRQGHEIVGACEIDKYARSIYQKHFPTVTIYDDATKVQVESLPHFEMLCAGFPCQTFSTSGKRSGFNDTRGTLFFEIVRIAKVKRPSYLFLENVTGLLNHNKGNTFRTMLQVLDEVGYDAEWQVINGKHWLPQKRERVIIIGHLRGQSTRQVFPIGEIPEMDDREKTSSNEITRALSGGGHSGGLHSEMTMIMLSNTKANIKQRVQKRKETWCLDTSGSYFAIKDLVGNIRRLTPLECERLQGFPDNWTSGISDTQRYKCLGNAVMVPKIEYILERLIN